MSENTPKQIDEEVRRLRHKHQVLNGNLAGVTHNIEWSTKLAQGMDKNARHAEIEPKKYDDEPDFYRSERDLALSILSGNVLKQGEYAEGVEANLGESKQHYEQNKTAYQRGAMAEAMMDGVHIDIDQSQDIPEAVNVKVIPHE